MSPVLVGLLAAGAVLLWWPARRAGPDQEGGVPGPRHEEALLRRYRWVVAVLAGFAAVAFVGGVVGWVLAVAAGGLTWVLASRSEPPALVRARRRAARELPHLVLLLASALRAGADPTMGLALVTAALPGPAADRLRPALSRLDVGVPPAVVWAGVAADPVLAPLGRALARAVESGAPVAEAVERLAEDLAESARAAAEDRARAVGVRAALPLGLCLLPAFLLVGIVPLVAGLLATITT